MDGTILVILLGLLFFVFILPIMAMTSARCANRKADQAHEKIRELEEKIRQHQRRLADGVEKPSIPPPRRQTEEHTEETWTAPAFSVPKPEPYRATPPPMPARQEEDCVVTNTPIRLRVEQETASPPSSFSIEQFLGVKLFAWLGGVALFFGVIFFVKYAFEHNLVSPVTRITLGFITGLGLLGGGLWTHRLEKYRVLAQSLCATGVLVLYGVSFAAHAVYRFPAFNQSMTFALMAVVTVAAFLTAVRLNALVVAVLGMLGGFITPLLLPLVQDHPLALFGYVALLNIGLLALASRGRWPFLANGAAMGTIGMLVFWTAHFFERGRYFFGNTTLVPMGIVLGFCVLFLAAAGKVSRDKSSSSHISASSFAMLLTALAFSFYFLCYRDITDRIFLFYGYVLIINVATILLGVLHPRIGKGVLLVGALTFLHLAIWTVENLTPEKLRETLVVYLAFGALHTVWPMIAEKWHVNHKGAPSVIPSEVAPWLPSAVIALMALALLQLPAVSMLLWPAILVANFLAIVVSARRGVVLPVFATLALTMLTATLWLFRMPREVPSLHTLLGVVMAFSFLFSGSGVWLAKLFASRGTHSPSSPEKFLPIASSAMPFLLLILMTQHISVLNPTPVFAAALLLVGLTLAVSLLGKLPLLAIGALACCLLLQWVWHESWFSHESPYVALTWYILFYALFTVFPFIFRKRCSAHAAPWIASALSGVGHFLLVHDLVKRAFPNDVMGLLPAAFAVPALIALGIEWQRSREINDLTKLRFAWFGGVALLFLTLAFPIQFDRQWLTICWALEGAALLWLFRRVPHQGLVFTGVGLLCASFVRLALNPAVFLEYERSGSVILNWYLYTYGIVSIALIGGGILAPRTPLAIDTKVIRTLLFTLGGILVFLLLNIQIADAFTEPGHRFLAFQFSGNFARDMTYTISWAIFALLLLVIGIVLKARGARYAAISLLALALIKLFLHDLANIENIFRIVALLCVGVIAFVASFLYQRFIPAERGP